MSNLHFVKMCGKVCRSVNRRQLKRQCRRYLYICRILQTLFTVYRNNFWYVYCLGVWGFFVFISWGGCSWGCGWCLFIFKITSFLTAPATELYFPEMERPFPDFHHQLFQPLEPSVDFDTSSSSSCSQYRISQHSREFSKVLQ